MSADYPSTNRATAEAVAKTVGVAYDPWMQHWPIEVADGDRSAEFLWTGDACES